MSRRVLGEDEWACPDAKCAHVNTAAYTHCCICGKARPRAKATAGQAIGKEVAEKSKGLFAAEDWACQKCGNINWARRNTCNMCNAPKAGELEARTGYGGGYMDRQVVEYRESRESDDEYDEFGRIKKKKKTAKGGENEQQQQLQEPQRPAEVLDKAPAAAHAVRPAVDHDDVDRPRVVERAPDVAEGDDDGEEEEEEESGSEADLAKYDLTEFDNIGNLASKAKAKVEPAPADENGRGDQSPAYSDCSCTCSGGSCSCSSPPSSPEPDVKERSRSDRDKRRHRSRSPRGDGRKRKSSRSRRDRSSHSRSRSRSKDRDGHRDRDGGRPKYRAWREDHGWMFV